MKHPPFWKRLLAALIDGFVIGSSMIFLILIATYVATIDYQNTLKALNLIFWIGTWWYFAGLESSDAQATWGKQVMDIKVTDLQENPINFYRATGRFFARILSILPVGIGYFMTPFTEQQQSLHDRITDTRVVVSS